MSTDEELERAARSFLRETERIVNEPGLDRLTDLAAALAALFAAGAAAQPLARVHWVSLTPSELADVAVPSWPQIQRLPDRFRQTMYAVYTDEYGREADVSEDSFGARLLDVYRIIARHIHALDRGVDRIRVLADLADGWTSSTGWAADAADLLRPLHELATW